MGVLSNNPERGAEREKKMKNIRLVTSFVTTLSPIGEIPIGAEVQITTILPDEWGIHYHGKMHWLNPAEALEKTSARIDWVDTFRIEVMAESLPQYDPRLWASEQPGAYVSSALWRVKGLLPVDGSLRFKGFSRVIRLQFYRGLGWVNTKPSRIRFTSRNIPHPKGLEAILGKFLTKHPGKNEVVILTDGRVAVGAVESFDSENHDVRHHGALPN